MILLPNNEHAAVRVDNDGSGQPLLYDPAGTYVAPNGPRVQTDFHSGDEAALLPYIQYHESNDGKGTVRVYTLDTTPEQESEIASRAFELGNTRPGYCADRVQRVISGIGPFANVPSPETLLLPPFPSDVERLVIDAIRGRRR
jgi:hypothetical protein